MTNETIHEFDLNADPGESRMYDKLFGSTPLFPPYRKKLNFDRAITQIIENNLGYLENLRQQIERTNNKETRCVRDMGDTMGGTVLSGIETDIDYYDLTELIHNLKDGLARRRVSLMPQTETT